MKQKQVIQLARQSILFALLTIGILFAASVSGQEKTGDLANVANVPPEVRLTLPESGAQFTAPAAINLAATASDRDGFVSTVEFFANERSLGIKTNNPLSASALNPFQLTWTDVMAGEYALQAKATDNRGASTRSAAVKVVVSSLPPQAVVNVETIKGEATEQGDSKSRTLSFRFARSGSRDIDLPVFYSVKGTATMGEDFPKLTGNLIIAKGAEAAELSFEVLDDNLPEPAETVIIHLEPPVCITIFPPPPECYRVGERSEARAVIAASDLEQFPVVSIVATVPETVEPSPTALVLPGKFTVSRTGPTNQPLIVRLNYSGTATFGLDYAEPPREATIPAGASSVELLVLAKDDNLVEGDESVIAEIVARPVADVAATVATQAYTLAPDRLSAKVVIHDNDKPTIEPPIVSITATVSETTEPSETVRVQPGRFIVTRKGDTRAVLTVWLGISGTADNGKDYSEIPRNLVFEAGSNSKEILVGPIDDSLVEGDEIVVLQIVAPPAILDAANAANYSIDPEHNAAKVVIHDNDRVVAESSLVITAPKDGAEFKAPALVRIEVTAIDPLGDIRLVEFYANGQFVGKSEQLTRDAVIPGRPRFHVFEWKDVSAGRYELIAKAKDTAGKEVVSKPVRIAVISGSDLPLVSVVATIPETSESSPLSLVKPGRFTISVRGAGNGGFPVFFEIGGTARNGEDYKKLAKWVILPGGTNTMDVDIAALDDTLVEGDETVELKLSTRQSDDFLLMMPIREYAIDPEHAGARVVIHDNDKPPGPATITITAPKDGDSFVNPAVINIAATAIDPNGYISRVEFYAGEQKIGVSDLVFVRAPDPGTPIYHTLEWRSPPVGTHVLTVRATGLPDRPVVSPPVRITVSGATDLPIVGIRFVPDPRDIAWPDADFAPGWFELSRTGATNNPLTIFFEVSGTATPGVDYAALARLIVIPPGENRAKLAVEAKDDLLPEGDETVVVALTIPPLTADATLRAGYRIDPEHAKASLIIHDNDVKPDRATLEVTSPKEGEQFRDPASIAISATAIDPNGYIPRVEFYAGEERIGVSELTFIRAPDPGTPLFHKIEWKRPPAGSHKLTARAVDSTSGRIVSKTVVITVMRSSERVIVTLEATDPKASELAGPDGAVDVATLTVRRAAGPRDVEVTVSYALEGTARNGIDYKELSGHVTLASGEDSARITITPISDKALEGEEMVVVKIQEPICPPVFPPPPQCYQIGSPGGAVAVIADSQVGQPPRVAIIRPVSGAVFSSEADIEIDAEASDANGFIAKVEFLADGRTISAQSAALLNTSPRGATQKFHFVWRDPLPGPHVLTVRATDNDGETTVSAPVEIKVNDSDSRTKVLVTTRDAFAVEPESNAELNTATFVIHRAGSNKESLAVKYSLHGTAENGVDYEKLSGVATIPEGANSTTVVVQPKADNLVEGIETVILQLEPSAAPETSSASYRVGPPQRASVVIHDALLVRSAAESAEKTKCTALSDGMLHLSFSGKGGVFFRVEATRDFVTWETVAEATVCDGRVHFVAETAGSQKKFYRIVPESTAPPED
jgi:hypothetical protein